MPLLIKLNINGKLGWSGTRVTNLIPHRCLMFLWFVGLFPFSCLKLNKVLHPTTYHVIAYYAFHFQLSGTILTDLVCRGILLCQTERRLGSLPGSSREIG